MGRSRSFRFWNTPDRFLFGLSFALLAAWGSWGCGAEPETPGVCEQIACAEGSVCSEADGLCHCAESNGPVCGETETCLIEQVACAPTTDAVCNQSSLWTPGVTAFNETTFDWGLEGVFGVRLVAVDFDSDGWTDLAVYRGGNGMDAFDEPDGLRYSWLLRNNEGTGFDDVTLESGLFYTRFDYGQTLGRPSGTVALADVDNDGDLDAYTGANTSDSTVTRNETSELMLNGGGYSYGFGPSDNPLRRESLLDVPAGASFVDVNLDGNLDLWVSENQHESTILQDQLYLGDGTGSFIAAVSVSGLTSAEWESLDDINAGLAHSRAWSSVACDLNNDGLPELMAGSYGRAPNHLWQARWEGDSVAYDNVSVASGFAFDDDTTWEENQYARCFCQSDRTAEGCADVPAPQIGCATPNWRHLSDRMPYRSGGNSAATFCADFDNDGDLDVFQGAIRHWWAGSGSDGSEVLVNRTQDGQAVALVHVGDPAMGLELNHESSTWDEGHMTGSALDFDNDGWLDLYIGASDYAGNHGLLYHNETAQRELADGESAQPLFSAVPIDSGIDHNRSHGVAVADFDRDGDLDVVVGHSRARCDANQPNNCYDTQQIRFFENQIGQDGNWIQLDLEGTPGTNRSAVGARVTVTANGVTQTQEVNGGYGHFGAQNDLVLHFGLGEACQAEVTVRWPDRELTEQSIWLLANERYSLIQGGAPEIAGR